MRMMRSMCTFALASLTAVYAGCGASGPAPMADGATPEEAVQKVNEAARLIEAEGEAALPEIRNRSGRFHWKDSYVFVFGLDGVLLAHPDSSLVGTNVADLRDVHGKEFGAEFLAIAGGETGKGWAEYWWPEPGQETPSRKVSYIMRVPGRDVAVGAGIHDVALEEARRAGM